MHKDAERAAALLRYANYAKVADALQVSRASVADWAKGQSVTPYRLNQLEQLLRPDLDVEEAPAPKWAQALARDTARQVIEALAPVDVQRAAAEVIARLEGTPQPGDVDPLDSDDGRDQDGLGTPERAHG